MNTQRTTAKKLTALAALPFAAALSLSACGSEEPTETAFTQEQGGVEMTLTYTHVAFPAPLELNFSSKLFQLSGGQLLLAGTTAASNHDGCHANGKVSGHQLH